MEKGKITKFKFGNKEEISLEYKRKSKLKHIKISYSFPEITEQYLNKECKFERNGPEILKIEVDGKTFYPKGSSNRNITEIKENYNINKCNIFPDYLKNANINKIDNFYLKFHKYAYYNSKDGFLLYKDKPYIKLTNNFTKIDFNRFNNTIKLIKESYLKRDYIVKELIFEPYEKLVVGMGDSSVYEISLTLHYIYGIPYIPASAIKGVVRNWIIREKFEGKEDKAFKDKYFCKIFGAIKESIIKNEYKGEIIFVDGFPIDEPKLQFDIMNPHYGEYYSNNTNNKVPGDFYLPVPIHFLTVTNTRFKFIIMYKDKDVSTYDNKSLVDWIKEAFKYNGIGAKTAVGYGHGDIKEVKAL